MRHADRNVRSVGEYVSALRDTASEGLTWFRGQEKESWRLLPGLIRPGGNIAAELTTIKRFKQSAAQYLLSRPQDEWEWIFLMQHHRAPTRLLDWSENSIVALYFATSSEVYDAEDGAVWCLDPVALNKLSGHNRAFELDILAFGIDPQLSDYLPDRINERVNKLNPVAAIGPRNSARMVAQSGTFTVIHAEPTAIEDVGDKKHIWRFIVPKNSKADIRKELKLLGVTEHSLFPDLDRVAALAKGFI